MAVHEPPSSTPSHRESWGLTLREPFAARLRNSLANPSIETALGRGMTTVAQRRALAFAGEDFPALQAALAERRRAAVAQLPDLVKRFQAEAERVGAVVHHAADAAESNAIVEQLARERDVKLAVKSKSMATEETGLREHLESLGIEVVETDLGEWIIQLAGDHPSHLIVPAIHHTAREIAALFSRRTGEPLPEDAAELVQVARRELRQKFIDAELGISGANVAVAETGSLVLVTNEGNGRLVTSLPPIHVAVVGIDKLVPSLDDVTATLRMLARSATGQRMTTYVSFITGPSRTADIELQLAIGVHGPKELHIVLLDNGRWAMRDDPDFREALQCIRCGACANVCPPYRIVGGHAFGHVYTGAIGLVLTPWHHGLEAAAGPQSLCLGCNACETVCPAGIPLPRQILDVRQRVVESSGLPWYKRALIQLLAPAPGRDLLTRLASWAQLPASRGDRFIRRLPVEVGPLTRAQTEWRSLPALARRPLRDRLKGYGTKRQEARGERRGDTGTRRHGDAETRGRGDTPSQRLGTVPSSKAAGRTVAYFAGCMTDRLFPEMGEAVVRVLEACGARVVWPDAQACCGLLAFNAGDAAAGRRMARQTVEALEAVEADYILSGSASCAVAMLQDYAHHFRHEPAWQGRAQRLAARVIDFTSFMARVAQLPPGALANDEPLRVTYHDSCQSFNCLGLGDEPRRIVREVLGLELAEMADSSVCCGFGGTFSIEHPEVSRRILAKKLEHIAATGVPIVVADNPGCLMHIRGGLDAAGSPIRALHLAELMASRLPR